MTEATTTGIVTVAAATATAAKNNQLKAAVEKAATMAAAGARGKRQEAARAARAARAVSILQENANRCPSCVGHKT